MNDLAANQIHEEVKARYGRLADEFKIDVSGSCCSPKAETGCCDVDEDALFSNLYTADTGWLPEDVQQILRHCEVIK